MDASSLEIVIRGMQAIARHHKITNAFLQQIFMDLDRNGLSGTVNMPWFMEMANSEWSSNIPLLARSAVSRHSNVAPVLPGRLPLGNPQGKVVPMKNSSGPLLAPRGTTATVKKLTNSDCYQPMLSAVNRNMMPSGAKKQNPVPSSESMQETTGHPANKRKRTDQSYVSDGMNVPQTWNSNDIAQASAASSTGHLSGNLFGTTTSYNSDMMDTSQQRGEMFVLPDRSTPSNSSSPAYRATSSSLADVLSSVSGASPAAGLGNTAEENRIDFRAFQDKITGPIWSPEEELFMKQMADSLVNGSLPGAVSEPWDFVTSDIPWQPDQQQQPQ